MPNLRLTVIVVTLDRPECLRRCLEHLRSQTLPVSQTIVVDGDPRRSAEPVVGEFSGFEYVHNANGFGRMTASRNLGLEHACGDIVAYVDDDAYADPEWAGQILEAYSDEKIGGVGGQALNNVAGERTRVGPVGRLTPWGDVVGNFGTDIERTVNVDHLIGCNMSFRRDLLQELGGFSEFYPNGRCSTFEELDLCMRLANLGYLIVYTSKASVFHEGAPRRIGARGDINYIFGATRNLLTILVRNRGVFSPIVARFIALSFWRSLSLFAFDCLRAILRFGAAACGIGAALLSSRKQRARRGKSLPLGEAQEIGMEGKAEPRACGVTEKA